MATSPATPTPDGRTQTRLFTRTRLILVIALATLLLLCVALSWVTSGSMGVLQRPEIEKSATGQNLVDLQPWQTAETLAWQAVSAEENEYAREAERLADHEVDQAFAAALRQARLDAQHKQLNGEAQPLAQKVAQLQQLKKQDQAFVNGLAAKAGKSPDAKSNDDDNASGDDDLDVAKAQLGLDSDELVDTQRDLARASGDHSDEIQDELAAHEAAMRKYDSGIATGQTAVLAVKQNHTLASRIDAWFKQRERVALIQQALNEAQSDVAMLTSQHGILEANANASDANGMAPDRASEISTLKNRSIESQILTIDDDRIQTEQQLAIVYGKWLAQVKRQHLIVLHLILESFVLIVLILLAITLGMSLVRRFLHHPNADRRQMRTLESVLALSMQGVGVLLILLVIFGAPQETSTMLGLATAALTIALQDYILAFLGWFVLMGKNGIRVGDWVEINGVGGEVKEIGLISTTLLETGKMPDQGHPTGRRISFMNGFAIRGQYFNFSTAGQWMWDEIEVSVPETADVNAVSEEVHKAVLKQTKADAEHAEREWKHGRQDDGSSLFHAEPVVSLLPSGAGIVLQVRYVTSAARRFEQRNALYQDVMGLLHSQQPPTK